MKRTLDAVSFNAIANDPEVRPWLGGIGDLDLTAIVRDVNNFCFMTAKQDGGYVLIKKAPALYEAHTLALQSARGRPMLECMKDGFAALFMGTDALEVTTVVPDGNDAAKRWAEVAGFKEMFRRPKAFNLMGEMNDATYFHLTYADWVLWDGRNEKLGELFHQRLDEVRTEHSSHPKDAVHDHWVGAAMATAIEGNLEKAVCNYNRWAVIAGYQVARILSVHPPVIDIGDAIVQLISGRLDILASSSAIASA